MVLRFFQTALILISAGITTAQTASLTLSLQDSSMFIAELNGVSYSDASNTMNISKLNPGVQKLKVIKLMQMGSSVVKKPVYEGSINLPANKTAMLRSWQSDPTRPRCVSLGHTESHTTNVSDPGVG